MPNLARLRTHTDALIDVLETELRVFDGGAPEDDPNPGEGWGWQGVPGQSAFIPYVIVYPLSGGIFDGPLGCPSDDASLIWQITCVGGDRQQCELTVDRVNALIVEQPLTVTGRHISRVWADMAGGGARRDDEVQPPVFIATPRYRIESSPSAGGS
jgi:hypothetical protein